MKRKFVVDISRMQHSPQGFWNLQSGIHKQCQEQKMEPLRRNHGRWPGEAWGDLGSEENRGLGGVREGKTTHDFGRLCLIWDLSNEHNVDKCRRVPKGCLKLKNNVSEESKAGMRRCWERTNFCLTLTFVGTCFKILPWILMESSLQYSGSPVLPLHLWLWNPSGLLFIFLLVDLAF